LRRELQNESSAASGEPPFRSVARRLARTGCEKATSMARPSPSERRPPYRRQTPQRCGEGAPLPETRIHRSFGPASTAIRRSFFCERVRPIRFRGSDNIGATIDAEENPVRFVFKLLNRFERRLAHAQGKGYGTATIDQEIKGVLQNLTAEPRLLIDVGGNVGNYTGAFLRLKPTIECHIFEPSHTNIEKLRVRFQDQPNVKIVPCAVSESPGAATLYADEPGSGLASLSKRKLDHMNITFETKETVSVIRFEDYWLDTLGKRNIDVLKLDIEGHELLALHGLGKSINNISVIQFEFGGCNIDSRTYFRDFWYFFKEHNFKLLRIAPIGLQEIEKYREHEEYFSTTNFLAVRQK
jgi:FkbM family methyltransferase